MKRTILLTISILLILSACSSPKPIPTITATSTKSFLPTNTSLPTLSIATSTPNRIDIAESWEAIRPYASHLFMGDNRISPDGQWIIANPFSTDDGKNNQIISIGDSKQLINIEYTSPGHESDLRMYEFDSWSPDSTAIAGVFGSGERHCCGNSVAVTNFSDGKSESWVYRWGWDEYPEIFWANDSSKIGLGFREYGFWIFDRKGNLLEKYSLNYIQDMIWIDNTIFAIAQQDNSYLSLHSMYSIDLKTKAVEKIYDFNGYISANLLGYQQNSNTLVLAEYTAYRKGQIVFFDIQSHGFSETSYSLENTYLLVPSQPFRYIGILVDDEADQNGFWILDTEENKLDYIGQTGILVGWYTNIKGFLVTTWENDEPKIIKP